MTLTHGPWAWILFNAFVLLMLAIDLGIFHRKSHKVSVKEALIWSAVWISLALVFNIGLYLVEGPRVALEFLTGYFIEKSLSVDNIFVFIMVFSYFSVPVEVQHKVLFWGILGALIMRAILILVGSALLAQFHWIIYIFGGFLIFTGVKMILVKEGPMNPESMWIIRAFKKLLPVTPQYEGDRFFLLRDGRRWATPLFLVLLVIEATDLVFAVDSIPAIFAVTTDPFIVYTSNVFAILGLRSLYFALAGMVDQFRYLKVGLAFVLMFVGIKMCAVGFYKIPIGVSLAVIVAILSASMLASRWIPESKAPPSV